MEEAKPHSRDGTPQDMGTNPIPHSVPTSQQVLPGTITWISLSGLTSAASGATIRSSGKAELKGQNQVSSLVLLPLFWRIVELAGFGTKFALMQVANKPVIQDELEGGPEQ